MAAPNSGKKPHPRRFDSPEQEAFLSLWRTYDRLRMLEDELFSKHDLTAQQYNALRLLKAEHPGALPRWNLPGGLFRGPRTSRGWSIGWSSADWWPASAWPITAGSSKLASPTPA